jgi:hypothetical protein
MNRILNALRTPSAMLAALVLALLPQGEHTAQVFLHFTHDASDSARFFSYAFAAAVEVAVLLFVLAGHKRISYAFAGASFLTNLVYYAIGGIAILSIAVLPVLLLSALLPACIMGYSHTIAESAHDIATPANLQTEPVRPWWRVWEKAVESPTTPSTTTTPVTSPVARPAGVWGHPGEWVITTETPIQDAAPKLTPEQRRAQIASAGLQSTVEVMQTFAIGKRTADADLAWVRKNVMHTNGVAK